MVTLSVIVPTCGNSSFLKQCLTSIHHQTFRDYEIIIVDCAQHPLRHELSKSIPHSVYTVQEGKGLNDARNKGLELSQGEIVLFLDDDTVLPPTFLQDVVKIFEEHSELYVAGFLDKPLKDNTYQQKCNRYVDNFSRKFLISKPFLKVKGAALAIRKKNHLRFDPRRKYYNADDTEFVYRMSKQGHIVQYFARPYLYHDAHSLPSILKITVTSLLSTEHWSGPFLLLFQTIVMLLAVGIFVLYTGARIPVIVGGLASGALLSLIISLTESGSPLYFSGILVHVLFRLLVAPLALLLYLTSRVAQSVTHLSFLLLH